MKPFLELLLQFCIALPFYFMGIHILFLLVKRQSLDDSFFSLSSKTSESNLIHRFLILSQLNGKDYSAEMMEVKQMCSDEHLDERELNRLDNIVKERYFDHSYNLRCVWSKLDPSLKWLCILVVFLIAVAVCIAFGGRMFGRVINREIDYSDPAIYQGFLFFPIGFLLGSLLLGFYGAVLLVISMFLPKRGSVHRARICIDRLWGGLASQVGNLVDRISPLK